MRNRSNLLIPVVALAAALAACGGSGPSKSAFTAKADAACTAGNAAISGTAKPTNAPQVATAAESTATTIDGQVGTLRAIKAPGGSDKAKVDGLITAIAEVSGPIRALKDAAAKSDDAAMGRAAVDMQSKVDAAATQAQAYGLTQCGTALKPAVANLFDGTKAVVKASYVTKAEAVCRDAAKKAATLAQPGASLASLAKFLDAELPIVTKVVTDIRAIPIPPGDEATVNEMTAAMDALTPKIKEVSAAARANNARLLSGLFDDADLASTQANAKLDAYGLKLCGSLGSF